MVIGEAFWIVVGGLAIGIPAALAAAVGARGILAGGPGGSYVSADGRNWREVKLWTEAETGAADFVHAYWMGRYYGWLPSR